MNFSNFKLEKFKEKLKIMDIIIVYVIKMIKIKNMLEEKFIIINRTGLKLKNFLILINKTKRILVEYFISLFQRNILNKK